MTGITGIRVSEPAANAAAFTILTGWLGAGKTTTLNRMLAAPHGRRVAVLVNELGRISIDTQLILGRGGDVLELAGGCVCCKVDTKQELWWSIDDVVKRSRPRHVVLETTGIAEPAAILENMPRVRAFAYGELVPAGVVCVVDAEAAPATLEKREEAREQIAAADRVLLTKLDVAPAAAVAATHAAIAALNPRAEVASFPGDLAGALALTAWVLEARTVAPPPVPHAHGPHVHGQIAAVVFVDTAPLVPPAVEAVVRGLGDRLIRAKGFVHLAGEPRRGFLEKAGLRTELRHGEPWGDDAPRTELVLIGEDLDEAAIQRALWACRSGG
jgi:G3E family GTPase